MSISAYKNPNNNTFPLAIAKGDLTEFIGVHGFGYNPDIDTTSDPETVWGAGGLYNWSSSAETLYLMSTSNSDTTVQMTVEGLNSSWEEISQTITLTGQTPIALPTALIRVNSVHNNSNVNLIGTVYLSSSNSATNGIPNISTDIKAQIPPEHQCSTIAIYSIPAGYIGYLFHVCMQASTSVVDFILRIREFDGCFLVKSRSLTGDSTSTEVDWLIPLELPEKTDIECLVQSVGHNNTTASCHFDLILVRQ